MNFKTDHRIGMLAVLLFTIFVFAYFSQPAWVQIDNHKLVVEGEVQKFLFLNRYNLISADRSRPCGFTHTEDSIEEYFKFSSDAGFNGLRFYATDYLTNNGQDFSALDTALYYARIYKMKVIVTVADHWNACNGEEDPRPRSENWYNNGYLRDGYLDYLAKLSGHLSNSPEVLAIETINEPEHSDINILIDFSNVAISVVQENSPNTIAYTPIIGGSQMGMGQNWLEFSLSGTQVASLHWYYQNLGTTFDNIAVWQDLSQNKPLFVGELGANTCNLDDSERVTLLAQVVNSLFASGVSLVNIWEGPSGVESVECTYALSWKQLGQLAQAIHW